MRTLLLMRGAPGSGKSTWIKENNLEQYTLSPDTIRVMCSSLELQPNGDYKISQNQNNEKVVWEMLFKLLEHRMSRGEFTVVDATCSKTKDITKYKELASNYRYRMYIVDFTDVPLETCLKQNKMRDEYKQVPEEAIRNIYSRFEGQQVPSGVKLIKRNEFDKVLETPIDLSSYNKLVFIGDIHGCYDTLMKYFKNGIKDDTEYIFLGDYIDRGTQNAEVLKFLYSIKDKENVCLIEGNHERNIKMFGDNIDNTPSKQFNNYTRKELIKKEFSRREARELYRKFRQCSHIYYNGIEILACHGGIPNLNKNLLFTPTRDFIHGVGTYSDYLTVTDSWMKQTKENQYLIHGHRNVESSPIDIADRVFNLEGRVEFGGQLRIVELDKNLNWNSILIDSIQPNKEEQKEEETKPLTPLEELRNNPFINEKDLGNDISSFNFTREAFFDRNWNKQTILARGLFLNNKTGDVVARSYEKFFNVNEVHETELASLKNTLIFPLEVYVKENGFLGIVSYYNDELFIATKSTNTGDYKEWFSKLLEPHKERIIKAYKKIKFLKDYSLVFEVIDVDNDPHIIKYDKSKLVLLDIIKNKIEFSKIDYLTLREVALTIGVEYKEIYYKLLNNWEEFKELYNNIQDYNYIYNGKRVEGFVIQDCKGFMFKLKTEYYKEWKKLREVAQSTLKNGSYRRTGSLVNKLENEFYNYLRKLYKNYYNKETKTYPFKTDIISLREEFEKINTQKEEN